ncbi:hypothetical protein HYDPIDRAFT_23519 [Hydnomerulius pinastri MD-312]|nr:hypothetical protein HYDPIDRAFT_23519 [Hydnomerulius pinastri MD-312]
MQVPPPYKHRDSYALTDFESIYFKPKQTTGPEFYDRSNLSRKVGLVGVGFAVLFSLFCIFEGIMIFLSKNAISSGVVVVSLGHGWQKELLCLGLNLMVTACTEATGFVHGISLRSALAAERRLRFNTNLRLLSAASGFFNPNGTFFNIVMAILLIVSYSSSLLVALSVDMDSSSGISEEGVAICVSDVPLIVLGISLLLQAIIALTGMRAADILTWSSSPFDITAALVHHAQIIPEPGRCMRGVRDGSSRGPTVPLSKQPSAWRAHPSVRKVILTLWALVVSCGVWGIIMMTLSDRDMARAFQSWSFFPHPQSHVIAYSIPLPGGVYWFYWVLYYVNMAIIQGPLTLALHCSELVANVIRDERVWRKASSPGGATVSTNPLAPVFGSPLNISLLLAKPLLHWMLGLAISLAGTAESGFLTAIAVSMFPFQILNFAGALFIFSLSFTIIAFCRPKGPQPAAYGHVQTLANLIDEWSPTMWWGQKSGGFPFRHAGTSDYCLPKVDMNMLYA